MSEPTAVRLEEWRDLQREVGRLRVLVIIALLAVIALAALSFLRRPEAPEQPGAIIRTRGLVITDASGRDRILIGAPTPDSKDRTRTDDHSDGIIFLGTTGADRLALGQMPAPFIGGKSYKRLGDGDNYGLTLYDTKGNERGGMGFIGMGRVGIALDRAHPPYDAVGMMVDDKEDFAGIMVNYGDPEARDSAIELGTDPHSVHIRINGKDGLPRANLDFDGSNTPAWQFNDAASAAKAAAATKAAQAETH